MADFPSLTPTIRPLTPGRWGGATLASMSGQTSTVRRSSAEIGRRVSLRFENITEAQFLQIVDHYRGQRSGLDGFNFNSATIPTAYTPSGHTWLYAGPPQVVDRHADVFTVELECRSEPRGPFRVSGVAFTTLPALTAGTVTPIVAGLAITPVESLTAGSVTPIVAGAALSVDFRSSSDPLFSQVQLLLPGDGANNSTTFVDSSSFARSITANGNIKISTDQSKWGGSSIYCDGSGDFLSFSAINIGTAADCTLEAWVRAASTSDLAIFGHSNTGANIQPLSILGGTISAFWGGNQVNIGAVSANTWTHVAITRASGVIRAFVGGTLTQTVSGTNTAALAIDRIGRGQFRGDYSGYLDDLRVTVGTARYTASFTPPAGPLPGLDVSSFGAGVVTPIVAGASYASISPSLAPGAPV